MAFSNIQSTVLDLAGGGTKSVAHDTVAAYDWIAVVLEGGSQDFSATVTYGGQAIAQKESVRAGTSYRGDGRCIVYARVASDGSMPSAGSNTFEVVVTGSPSAGKARIWTGQATTPAILSDSDTASNESASASIVCGANDAIVFMAANAGGSGAALIHSGIDACDQDLTTLTHVSGGVITNYGVLARSDVETGTVTVSFLETAIGIALVGIVEGVVAIMPGRLGEQVAWRAGLTLTAPSDGTVFLTRLGERVRWRPGLRVTSTAQRQVALVGGGLETPEMTVGGTEGQVLTQHAKSPPTWEPAGGGDASLHIDTSVSGAHTVDREDGASHDLTLVDDATFTLDGAATGITTDWRILIRQPSSGGPHTVTWADDIAWVGGSPPTLQTDPDAVDTIGILTVDDGATFFGFHATPGSGPAIDPASTVEDETTWGITPAVGDSDDYARADHTHGTPEEPSGGTGHLLLASDHASPIEFADILQASDGSDFLYASEP